jgi:hypothetical protein
VLLLSEAQYRRGAVPLSGMKEMGYRHEYCRTPVQDLQSLRSRIRWIVLDLQERQLINEQQIQQERLAAGFHRYVRM